ncbi:xylulokinase [soil metagenome]
MSRSSAPVSIGLDLGTSGLKAVALTVSGEVVGRARSDYPTNRPEPGAAEHSTADWRTALESVLEALGRQTEPRQWLSIGLSAMLPTLVRLDGRREPIEPAVTWEDNRAAAEAADFIAAHGLERIYRATGQYLDARYLLPMYDRCPVEGTTIAAAKDYLFLLLTGELATDPSTAAGYGVFALDSGSWDRDLATGLRLPPVLPSSTSAPLRTELAVRFGCATDLPVVLGGADSVLGALGLGVSRQGDVAYVAGSSTVILSHSESLLLDDRMRYIVTPMATEGFGLEMDLLSTGSAFGWLARLLNLQGGVLELMRLAERGDALAEPIFLPYVAPGEQGALWDDTLTGTLSGLTLRTEPADLARALVSGIVLESRRCFAVLDADGARRHGIVRVTGRSVASGLMRQDLADATGRVIEYVENETDHSAVGAALLAGNVICQWPLSIEWPVVVTEPRAERHQRWADLAAGHDELRLRLEKR